MADASREPPAHGWGDVFAALPLESPPESRWPQLDARLDARNRPARNPRIWLALAAGLCALAALPLAWTLRDADDVAGSVGASSVSTTVSATTSAPADTIATPDAVPPAAQAKPAPQPSLGTPSMQPVLATARTHSPSTVRRQRASERQPATTGRERGVTATADAASATLPADNASDDALESLYTASAQLETLLAAARDTRVESGPAAALAGSIDAELATIDAHLAQPNLPNAERLSLWQARVETLQASAGFESQMRLLAAHGGRLDGALVSID